MELAEAMAFAGEHRRSVLVTLRRDGRPQLSNVLHIPDADGWPDYRPAMVRDRRLLLRLRPDHAYGML
jgi:hypothetical protein